MEDLGAMLSSVKQKVKGYKQQFVKEQQELKGTPTINTANKSYVGDNSVPICVDVTNFNFDLLIKKQL